MKRFYKINPLIIRFLFGSIMAVPIMLAGCYRVSTYAGDGLLIDNGVSAATDRYVLNLGPVDLAQRGIRTFRIAHLPDTNFVVGLELVASNNNIERKAANPTIAIELTSLDGQILFAKKAPLNTWTWAVQAGEHQAFVYGRDEPRTYFDVTSNAELTLTLKVIEPDRSQSKYTASLIAKSGGWK